MSTKDYGCFLCKGKSSTPSGTCDLCSASVDVSSFLLDLSIGGYTIKDVLGRGFNGWMLKVEDAYQPFAMKIIPWHRLKQGAIPDTEARALAACAPHRNIARFVRPVEGEILVHGRGVKVFCLVFEFIDNAKSLRFLYEDPSAELEKRDVAGILIGIASGLARMHQNGIWHDDLHDDNVLVRTVGTDENLNERFEAKLIDFGSTKPLLEGAPEPVRSDYNYLSKHIFNIVLAFEKTKQGFLTPADRTFAARLRRLGHFLSDINISRRELTPREVTDQLRSALEECTTGHSFPSFDEMKQQMSISFNEPLANTNALSLAHQDIGLLFRDSLGWTQRIAKSEPVFLVGPRGCGKTMLLRYLSIASCARPCRDEENREAVAERLSKMAYVGFLVNVGQMRTPFLRSGYKSLEERDAARAEDFCREYLNAQFAFEVIRTLIWLDTEKLMTLTEDDRTAVATVISELADVRNPNGSIPVLETIAEFLDRKIIALSSLSDPVGYVPTNLSRDDVLVRLARCLKTTSCCSQKEIWFLLDDYSVTVLPLLAQKAYNPVLFRLSEDLKIKISSEGDGPFLSDTLGRKYREGRELTKVNLGEVYFACDEDSGKEFFEQILEARFQATGKGSLDELRRRLSEHEHEKEFGAYIRSQSRPGDARFYGFGLVCRLCSGDVSFIIELLHALTKGSWGKTEAPLTPHQQDVIVKRFAQRQLAELRSTSDHGNQLYNFSLSVGDVIKQYLLHSKGKPDERLRIEIEGTGELSDKAQRLQDALLRHSVLIFGGAGKSQSGAPTRKLYFRRIFAPCFPFSPTRRGCIAVTFEEYETWLLDPTKMRDQILRKLAKSASTPSTLTFPPNDPGQERFRF